MKKFICIVLTVVLALSCMSAFAAEPLSSQEGGTTAQERITPFGSTPFLSSLLFLAALEHIPAQSMVFPGQPRFLLPWYYTRKVG